MAKSKRTDDRVEYILDALRKGNTKRAAALCAGITEETFYVWMKSDVTFSESVRKAEASAEMGMVANIVAAGANGNWTASAWWLERRLPQAWGRIDRVEVTLRAEAERIATELGIPVEDVLAEAEAVLAASSVTA